MKRIGRRVVAGRQSRTYKLHQQSPFSLPCFPLSLPLPLPVALHQPKTASVRPFVCLSVRPPAHPSFETYADASWYKQGEEQAIEKREYNRRIPSHTPPNIKALKNGHPELLKLNSKFFAHSLLCCVSRRFSCLRTEITVEDLNPEKKGRNTTLLVCCSFCVVDCRLFIESAAVALDSTCTSKHSLSFSSSCLSLPSSPPTPPPH